MSLGSLAESVSLSLVVVLPLIQTSPSSPLKPPMQYASPDESQGSSTAALNMRLSSCQGCPVSTNSHIGKGRPTYLSIVQNVSMLSYTSCTMTNSSNNSRPENLAVNPTWTMVMGIRRIIMLET